jgi:hypothetical protein
MMVAIIDLVAFSLAIDHVYGRFGAVRFWYEKGA